MVEVRSLSELETEPHAEVFERPRPRTIRLQLEADQRIPPHRHPGTDIVLYLVAGRIELTVSSDEFELEANDVVQFSGDQSVSPYALERSTALLIFAPQPEAVRNELEE